MGKYADCVRYVREQLPKKAIFAFNFCADAVVNDHGLKPVASVTMRQGLQTEATAFHVRVRSSAASRQRLPRIRGRSVKTSVRKILALPFVERDAKLVKDVSSGVQREIFIGNAEASLLKKLFPNAKMRVGGQAGFGAANALALGVKPTVIAASGAHFPSLRGLPVHFVLEYAVRGKRSRFIAAHEESGVPSKVPQGARGFSHIFLGGFHLLKTREDMARAVRFVVLLKKKNPRAKVFIEAGEFQKKECISAFSNAVLPFADFIGVNEVELRQLAGGSGKGAARKLCKKVPKVLFHSENSSFGYPSGKNDAKAMLFAKVAASYMAKYGKCGSIAALGKYAKEARSLRVENPKYTVGLGDTFSSAYFLVSK